jgi:UDP-N-acetyl-D-mannosaminuronic acid transferase (WecB/TagA/CpsF family)
MEWFFRVLLEPRRLAKRYLYTNIAFIWTLVRELRAKHPQSFRP